MCGVTPIDLARQWHVPQHRSYSSILAQGGPKSGPFPIMDKNHIKNRMTPASEVRYSVQMRAYHRTLIYFQLV